MSITTNQAIRNSPSGWVGGYVFGVVFAILLCALLVYPSSLLAKDTAKLLDNNKEKIMNSADLEKKGKQLRAEIEKKDEEFGKSQKLGLQNIITDVVEQYIPVGTSFEDAQIILNAAGLKPHIQEFPKMRKGEPKLSVIQGSVSLHDAIFTKTDVSIDLYPKVPNDFTSEIGKIWAAIFYSSL